MSDSLGALSAIVRLSDRAAKDPARAPAYAAKIRRLAEQARSDDVQATRGYVVPAVTALAQATTSNGFALKFPRAGRVIAMYGSVVGASDQFGLASIGLRVNIGGQEELFTDGQGFAFMPFATMFAYGGAFNRDQAGPGWALDRLVGAGEVWTFFFKNVGTATYTPSVALSFADTKRGL